MITARAIRAALKHDVELTNSGTPRKVASPRKKKNQGGAAIPKPKVRSPRLVAETAVWDDLERVMRQNSAHGIPRVEHERIIHPVSGREFRERIYNLGFSVTHFARRHDVTPSVIYGLTHAPAGMILTRYIRMLEYEETLATIADVLEDPGITLEDVRLRLGKLLEDAADRL